MSERFGTTRDGRRGYMTLRVACRSTIALGILSAVTMGLAFLALTDIYHGEADTTAEWQALRLALLVCAAFHVVAVVAAVKGVRGTSGQ